LLIDAWHGSGFEVGAASAGAAAISVLATVITPRPVMAITCENVRIVLSDPKLRKFFFLKLHPLLWIGINFGGKGE
jgi:hypothetical protein